MQGGSMRDCGCPKGRKCTCEKDFEEDFSCGTCEMCLKVQAQRKKGKGKAKIMSKCLRARLYKDRHLHDYIAMGDADFILKMPKALKEDVLHLKPKFQEIYQMRIILNEEKPKYELQIKEETQYIRKYGLQLDDVRKRQQKILALNPQDAEYAKKKQALSKISSNAMYHMAAQMVDVSVLEPILKKNLDKAESRRRQARSDLTSLLTGVSERTIIELQRCLRGIMCRRRVKMYKEWIWKGSELSAAVEIQRIVRGSCLRWRIVEWKTNEILRRQAVARAVLQRCIRGHLGRIKAARCRKERDIARIYQSATKIQSVVRMFLSRRNVDELRVTVAQQKFKGQLHGSATAIQKHFRGYVDRKLVWRKKFQNSLDGRVKALADRYIAKGDFWEFLSAINEDYKAHAIERAEEEMNAKTFIQIVLERREKERERTLQQWHLSTAQNNERVSHFQRVQSAYIPPLTAADQVQVTPKRKSAEFVPADRFSNRATRSQAPKANACSIFGPQEMSLKFEKIRPGTKFQTECGVPRRQAPITLSEKDMKRYGSLFDPNLIIKGMTAGYALNDVVATLRGLKALGRSTSNAKLMLRTLERKAPLMITPYKSEREVRQERMKANPPSLPILEPAEDTRSIQWSAGSSGPRGTLHTPMTYSAASRPASSFSNRNITRDIPFGNDDKIERLLKLAALRIYTPVRGPDGLYYRGDFQKSEEPFEEYLNLGSDIEMARREHLALEAVQPYIDVLKANNCHTVGSVPMGPNAVGMMTGWGLPIQLAHKVLDLIREYENTRNFLSREKLSRQLQDVRDQGRCSSSMGSRNVPLSRSVPNAISRPDTADTVDTVVYGNEPFYRPGTADTAVSFGSFRPDSRGRLSTPNNIDMRPASRGGPLEDVMETINGDNMMILTYPKALVPSGQLRPNSRGSTPSNIDMRPASRSGPLEDLVETTGENNIMILSHPEARVQTPPRGNTLEALDQSKRPSSAVKYTNPTNYLAKSDSQTMDELRIAIEQDLLVPSSLDGNISDIIFQAIFRICSITCSGYDLTAESGAGPENLERFMQLLSQVPRHKVDTLKDMIRERSRYAAMLASKYVSTLQSAGYQRIRDLANCKYEGIPPLLADTLRKLLATVLVTSSALNARPHLGGRKKKALQCHQMFDSRYQRSASDPAGIPPRIDSGKPLRPLRMKANKRKKKYTKRANPSPLLARNHYSSVGSENVDVSTLGY